MTKINNNAFNPYSKIGDNKSSEPKETNLDKLLNQVKSKKNDALDLDIKLLKQKDTRNSNNNQTEKLWSYGCLETKGGVHCPNPDYPKPKPNKKNPLKKY